MAENSAGSPVFADRYKFQTVGNDWDRGRSGFTYLVFDIKKELLGVIKRAEIKSQQAVDGLKNEVAALLDLKGVGVPEVYDTGETEYGSKNYFYVVMEYIEGIRIEKNLDTLSASERAEILTQFFSALANAHRLGIVNGDVDLKHLFWRKDKKQLIIIDWGNAKLDVNPKSKTEFAYDLARSAEIIYSLTALKGQLSATGSIALPNDSALVPGMAPLPAEFRTLCKWAPRIPNEGAQSPHTAQELFEASKAWQKGVRSAKPYKPTKRANWGLRLLFGFVIIAALFLGAILPNSPLHSLIFPSKTSTPTVTASDTPISTNTLEAITPSETPSPTATSADVATLTPTESVPPTDTAIPAITPIARSYIDVAPAREFKGNSPSDICWTDETNLPNGNNDLKFNEGFYQRDDTNKNWGFKIEKERALDQFILTDFNPCLDGKSAIGIALNAWVSRLDLQRDSPDQPGIIEPGKEFGIFVEDETGHRREYTLWVDKDELMHLRVRDGDSIILDDAILIVNQQNLKIEGSFPRFRAQFPIQFFLEINNNNLDIIYLREGPLQLPTELKDLDPNNMTKIDKAVLPTMGTIKKIGLIGYGGDVQTVIWPLVFFGEPK